MKYIITIIALLATLQAEVKLSDECEKCMKCQVRLENYKTEAKLNKYELKLYEQTIRSYHKLIHSLCECNTDEG